MVRRREAAGRRRRAMSLERDRKRGQCELRGGGEDSRRARVALHVPVHLRSPRWQAVLRRAHASTHHHDGGSCQTPGPGDLEQREVGVGADGDDRRSLLDAVVEKVEGGAGRRRSGSNRRRPEAFVVGNGTGAGEGGQRHLGSRSNRDVVAACELEAVGNVAGSAATRVDGRRDADELDVRPTEEHGQRAGIVGVRAEVGVEMYPHDEIMPVASCYRSPTLSTYLQRKIR